jgi:hypothetical protein
VLSPTPSAAQAIMMMKSNPSMTDEGDLSPGQDCDVSKQRLLLLLF